MNIQNFYKQCDSIINQWISNNNALLNNDPFLNKQKPKKGLLKKKYFDTMPEPFWGDPDHCSIVMINLNPAYKEGHDKLFSREKTQTLCPNGYSAFAKSFPILNEDSYNEDGKGWWEGRKKYLDQLIEDYPKKKQLAINNLRPFAIEVCPWQSSTWADAKVKMEDEDLKKHISKYVIEPALYAINHSMVDFAIAIGADILKVLLNNGFELEMSWGPSVDVVGKKFDNLHANNCCPANYPKTEKFRNKTGPKKNWISLGMYEAYVFYRLLTKTVDGKKLKILSVMKYGTNKVPGPKFHKRGIEKDILTYISKIP